MKTALLTVFTNVSGAHYYIPIEEQLYTQCNE